jgi:hypothetical protein
MTLKMTPQHSTCTEATLHVSLVQVERNPIMREHRLFTLAKVGAFSIFACSFFLNIVYTLNIDKMLQEAMEHLKGLGLETRLKNNNQLTLKKRKSLQTELSKDFEVQASHRLEHKRYGTLVDLVPFGGVAEDEIIYFPKSDMKLSVLGFDTALRHAEQILLEE